MRASTGPPSGLPAPVAGTTARGDVTTPAGDAEAAEEAAGADEVEVADAHALDVEFVPSVALACGCAVIGRLRVGAARSRSVTGALGTGLAELQPLPIVSMMIDMLTD